MNEDHKECSTIQTHQTTSEAMRNQFSVLLCIKICVPFVLLFVLVSLFMLDSLTLVIQDSYHSKEIKIVETRNTTTHFELHNKSVIVSSQQEAEFKVDPNPNAPFPRVAWLMTYPNSGTSFTMLLVRDGGMSDIATNYGKEDIHNLENLPLYPDSPNGPYLLNTNKTLPSKYILTKTHCGMRCVTCSPRHYMETQTHFMNRCAQGSRKDISSESGKEILFYDPHLAQRAIHIIRNPFDNIVSNFHLEANKAKKRHKEPMYPNNIDGFRKWCSDQDSKYSTQEYQLLPKEVVEFFEEGNIPCHAHFYKFAKWHDYTVQVIKELKLPSLTFYYEDYETNFNTTVNQIFDFLEVPQAGNIPNFIGGKTYVDFYTRKERDAAMLLMKHLVTERVWGLFQRYAE